MSDTEKRFSKKYPQSQLPQANLSLSQSLPQLVVTDPSADSSFTRSLQKSLISALGKSRQFIQSNSITRIVQCKANHRTATTHLRQLNASEIKKCILLHIDSDIQIFSKKLDESNPSNKQNQNPQQQRPKGDHESIIKFYLEGLAQKASTSLKQKNKHKNIYQFITLKWTKSFFELFLTFLNNSQSIDEKASIVEENTNVNKKSTSENEGINTIQSHIPLQYYNQSKIFNLIDTIQDKPLAQRLRLHVFSLTSSLKATQNELLSSQKYNSQLGSLLQQQIKLINIQTEQNRQLQEQLLFSNSELALLQERCSKVEQQLALELSTLEMVKQQQTPKGYYSNPFWQKDQLQQKYYSQIIQLQSDLYLERTQIKTLVDLIIEQIKLTHQAFYDLRASKFFFSKFDGDLLKRLKQLKAFDCVNLDQILIVKDECLLSETDQKNEMFRSTISTFSSGELQHKLPRLIKELFQDQTELVI